MATALAPIVDYVTLMSAIAVWVDRTDFGPVSPVLTGLAHARLNRTLRTRDMLQRSVADLTAGAEFVDLPNDFVELLRAKPLTSPPSRPLTVMTADQQSLRTGENVTDSAVPTSYSLFGNSLMLAPLPSGAFSLEILYYGQIPLLTPTQPVNWLISKWPEAYLFGALTESAPYLKADDRMSLWKARFEEIINEIQGASDRATLAGGRMVNRTGPLA